MASRRWCFDAPGQLVKIAEKREQLGAEYLERAEIAPQG
jgi:hypothetical protein